MKLVIVESPAKAKTISRFLGKDYRVEASFGHVRDLPSSAAEIPKKYKSESWARLGVDVDNDFAPIYVVQSDSKKHIAALKKLVKEADEVVLATDEDREGESISWHLLETLKPKMPVSRIVFHEITRSAIQEAIANPRDVDDQLVRAQESRRILDRLYGYSLSPVLWKKVRPKLSAGRVQSVAVRLVVEREEERRAFCTAGYWDIEAALSADDIEFKAALVELDGDRLATGKDFDAATGQLKTDDVAWLDEDRASALAEAVARNVPWPVVRVDQKQARQRPSAPFITSTLQQSASANLGFTPRRTMQVAQRLYEGVDLGGGEREGLITYMRTDSVVLSQKALDEAGVVIAKRFGDNYHQSRQYKTKSRLAQEAHEAIRPTHLDRVPDDVARLLSAEELKLYRLIWNRTIASQMADAELLKTTVDFKAETPDGAGIFRANGSVVTFPGFLKVADSAQKDTVLPNVDRNMCAGPGEAIAIGEVLPLGHETKPPARYTEATLVRRLEEEGIGRPSTYAPTISLIQQRDYVEKRGNALVPTFLGIAVVMLLRRHFGEYVDLKFTARMEDVLDSIARGEQDWKGFLEGFYRGHEDFGHGLQPQIDRELEKIEFPAITLGEDAEGQPMVVRVGRSAAFIQRGEGGEGNTVSVPNDLSWDELTVQKAADLFEERKNANRHLGDDPETGVPVYAIIGPYGPYVQLGEAEKGSKKKPKRSSLPKGSSIDDVDLDTALRHLSLPRKLGEHPESGKRVAAGVGRFGPYVVCDGDFRSLPKEEDILTVTFERALELLAQPKRTRQTRKPLRSLGAHPESKNDVGLFEGRYGPYVSDGKVNASLPKGEDPDGVTLDRAVALLAEAPKKKRPKKRAAAK